MTGASASQARSSSFGGDALQAPPYVNMANNGRYFSGSADWPYNTANGTTQQSGAHALVSVMLDWPVELAPIGAMDPWLAVRDMDKGTSWAVHLGPRDAAGFPYAMVLPSNWCNAKENVDLGYAYPRFRNFVESGGKQDIDWQLARHRQPGEARVPEAGLVSGRLNC